MKFGAYVDALFSTGFFGKNKACLGHNLFRAAGSKTEISESAMQTWIRGTRQCRIGQHFPDNAINESEFISFLKRYMPNHDSWKKLQKAFKSQQTTDSEDENFCVDLQTENPEIFYWSLLNQFQKIFHLPASEQKGSTPTVSAVTASSNKFPAEQMRALFLESVQNYKVMDSINRPSAILDRNDSARLNIFLDKMDTLMIYRDSDDVSLDASIRSFIEALRIQVLSLDATLNSRFGFDDDTAFVNMEDDEDWNKNNSTKKGDRSELPDLSLDLILESADPVSMGKLAVLEWGNFRDKMNHLFNEISTWQNKS